MMDDRLTYEGDPVHGFVYLVKAGKKVACIYGKNDDKIKLAKEITEAWNTRADAERVKELEEMLEKLEGQYNHSCTLFDSAKIRADNAEYKAASLVATLTERVKVLEDAYDKLHSLLGEALHGSLDDAEGVMAFNHRLTTAYSELRRQALKTEED